MVPHRRTYVGRKLRADGGIPPSPAPAVGTPAPAARFRLSPVAAFEDDYHPRNRRPACLRTPCTPAVQKANPPGRCAPAIGRAGRCRGSRVGARCRVQSAPAKYPSPAGGRSLFRARSGPGVWERRRRDRDGDRPISYPPQPAPPGRSVHPSPLLWDSSAGARRRGKSRSRRPSRRTSLCPATDGKAGDSGARAQGPKKHVVGQPDLNLSRRAPL